MKPITAFFSALLLAGPLHLPAQKTATDQLALFDHDFRHTSPALVDMNGYDSLMHIVSAYREKRLIPLSRFHAMSKEPNTVILDTRSDAMYKAKHVKGAIHLNFADFTQARLNELIPDVNTRILIYCNNNFEEGIPTLTLFNPAVLAQSAFVTKVSIPSFPALPFTAAKADSPSRSRKGTDTKTEDSSPQTVPGQEKAGATSQDATPDTIAANKKPLMLALNIPTFINLYGYGYRNVYELGELVNVNDSRIEFEGNQVQKSSLSGSAGKTNLAGQAADTGRSPFVDMKAYDSLTHVVIPHREKHLVHLDSFLAMAKENGVIILDTRSDEMYQAKHIKGAVHLNFSDFNMFSLANLIPDKNTKILIYCNNNFIDDPNHFASKMYTPPTRLDGSLPEENALTLALNIPTYLNLFGYGYQEVYELADLVSVRNPGIAFEGTAVGK